MQEMQLLAEFCCAVGQLTPLVVLYAKEHPAVKVNKVSSHHLRLVLHAMPCRVPRQGEGGGGGPFPTPPHLHAALVHL